MACTTILVGKKASYDGSTMIARNDDSPSGRFTPKKYVVVHPDEQPRKYMSVLSHVEIDLPDNPMRYTAVPNALEGEGIWAASGVNEANVAMTATETITSNPRVLGADPLVVYQPAKDGQLLPLYKSDQFHHRTPDVLSRSNDHWLCVSVPCSDVPLAYIHYYLVITSFFMPPLFPSH